MKVEHEFSPVVVTIETEQELKIFTAMVATSRFERVPDESGLDLSLVRDTIMALHNALSNYHGRKTKIC